MLRNEAFRDVFADDAELADAEGRALARDRSPLTRAARGESFETDVTVRSGTRSHRVHLRVEGAPGGGAVMRAEASKPS